MTRAWPGAIALLLGGCLTPTAQTCGDLLCPEDALCVDDTRCVTHDAVTACTGMSVGAGCEVANQYGRCAQESAADVACEPAACGDGVIDPPLREACDGSAPFAAQCVDLGYDAGLPGCTTGCALDPAPCTRFGWDVAVDAPISAMWTDGTVLAYVRHDPERVIVQGGPFAVELAMTVAELHGGGGRVIGREADGTLYDFTPTGPLRIELPPGTPAVSAIDVDDAGALYALGTGCTIWRERAGWTKVHDEPAGACSGLFLAGSRVFAIGGNRATELVAGALLPRFNVSGVVSGVRFAGPVAYVATTNGFFAWPGTGSDLMLLASGDARSVAVSGTHGFAAFGDGHAVRWDGTHLDPFTPPTPALADDGHGTLYAYRGPIYRYSGAQFGSLSPLALAPTEEVLGAAATADGGLFVATGQALFVPDPTAAGWSALQTSPTPIHALAATSRDEAVFAFYAASLPPRLLRYSAGTWDAQVVASGATAVDGLWMSPDGATYGAGQGGSGGWLGASSPAHGPWTHQDVPGCAFFAIDGRVVGTTTRVVAAGECNGNPATWELQGATWVELDRDPSVTATLRAVRVLTSGDVVATGDQLTRWQVGGAWRSTTAVLGRSVAGDVGDVWIAGSFTPIQHWDGRAWSKVTTRPLGPIAVAVTPSRVVMAGAALGHVALLRD